MREGTYILNLLKLVILKTTCYIAYRVQLTLTPFVVVVHPLLLAAELVRPGGHAQALRLGGLEAALGAGDCLVLLIPSKQDL